MRAPVFAPMRGSSPAPSSAGNSSPVVALVQGFLKGWTVDGGLFGVDKK